jgi:hypothetical protein
MDPAPGPPLPDGVDPERGDHNEEHERDPQIADGTVPRCAFGQGQLHEGREEGGHRSKGVHLNDTRLVRSGSSDIVGDLIDPQLAGELQDISQRKAPSSPR